MKKHLVLALMMLITLIAIPFATAEIVTCGQVLTDNTDIENKFLKCDGPGNALTIAADNIRIDCNGIALIGNDQGTGIDLQGHTGVILDSCNVHRFNTGVAATEVYVADFSEVCHNGIDFIGTNLGTGNTCDSGGCAETCQQQAEGIVTYNSGFNLISPPADPYYQMKARDIVNTLEAEGASIVVIYRWSGVGYSVHLSMASSTFNNFDILPGEGYWVYSDVPYTETIKGNALPATNLRTLVAGFNLISPGITTAASLSAEGWGSMMGNCNDDPNEPIIYNWNQGSWDIHLMEAAPSFNNFEVGEGKGYFVYCPQGTSVNFDNSLNTAPTLNSITDANVDEDANVVKNILSSVADVDSASWTAEVTSINAAELAVAVDGTQLTITPAADFNGIASFSVRVSDGEYDSGIQAVNVDVAALPDAPTASDNTVVTDEDVDHVFIADDFNFADVDAGDALASVKVTSLPLIGSLELSSVPVSLNQDITEADITAGNLVFVPVADANGLSYDSFTFTVSDGSLESIASTMTLDVTPINDAPTFTTAPPSSINEDIQHAYDADATDIELDTLTFSLVTGPAGLTVDVNTGLVNTWTPGNDQVGIHAITVRVSDGNDFTDQSYSLTVINTNPVISSTAVTAATQDALYNYNVASDDEGLGTTAYSLTVNPAGMSIDASTGVISWTPDNAAAFANPHDVTIEVDDGNGGLDSQSYQITVANVNDAPAIAGIVTQAFAEDSGLNTLIDLDTYVTDADSDTVFTFAIDAENTAEVDCAISGTTLQMTPAGDFFGSASCDITADDGNTNGVSVAYTVNIDVSGVNDAPVVTAAVVDLGTLPSGDLIDHTVACNDIDLDVLSYFDDSPRYNIDSVSGQILWTPLAADASVAGTFYEYTNTCDDGNTGTDQQTFRVTLTCIADAQPCDNPSQADQHCCSGTCGGFGLC